MGNENLNVTEYFQDLDRKAEELLPYEETRQKYRTMSPEELGSERELLMGDLIVYSIDNFALAFGTPLKTKKGGKGKSLQATITSPRDQLMAVKQRRLSILNKVIEEKSETLGDILKGLLMQ